MSRLTEEELQSRIEQAARAIRDATALLFTSGAGLGVDSGLPDYRGPEGFWKAYPPMRAMGLRLPSVSTPEWFERNPSFAWGFWAHRLKLYRNTEPHSGFEVMKRLGESKLNQEGYFVFTSNIDGAFFKAGFPQNNVLECHGSVHWIQCATPCSLDIWSAEDVQVEVDERTFLSPGPLPKCPRCSSLARPNVLMFTDMEFSPSRYLEQQSRYGEWLQSLTQDSRLVVVEVGAGITVPTVRRESERKAYEEKWKGTLIRINLQDTDAPEGSIVLPVGGKDALNLIEQAVFK